VSLSEASRVLGVSPATLRRWSDAGRLRVFTTPGGHRRFSRAVLERLLPADRSRRPSIGGGGLTPSRIARTYRRASREAAPELPWVLKLTDEQRLLFRERGHVLAASLLMYLDATQPAVAAHHLKEASASAADYGRVAAALGLSLSQTVEGFSALPGAVPSRTGRRSTAAWLRHGGDDRPARDRRASDGQAARGHDERSRARRPSGPAHEAGRSAGRRGSGSVTEAASGAVVALVTHARHVPAVERAGFRTSLDRAFDGHALILETCHRVEAYLATGDDLESVALALELPAGGELLTGEIAVRHAVTVAVGRDSVVVGEDQILHQLRATVDAARADGNLDPGLERLFALALQAGRRARSWQPGRRPSLADVAVESIERRAGTVRGREILVVGTGRMGRLSAKAALAAGALVAVANRHARRRGDARGVGRRSRREI